MSWLPPIEAVVEWILYALLPITAFGAFCCYILSLPVQRQERTRFFLTLIEIGLKAGWSLKQTLVAMSQTGDVVFGPRFHVLAAFVESGYSLGRAIDRVPGFLEPRVAGALKAAEETGEMDKVLPMCRAMLQGANSQVRAAINYQILLLLVLNPLVWLTMPFVMERVVPVFGEIYAGFGSPLPPIFVLMKDLKPLIQFSQIFLSLCLLAAALFYVGGPRFTSWLQAGLYPFCDWITLKIPWRRKRILRDFSVLLAIFLDAELPEDRALLLAAESVDNRIFLRRAEQVEKALQQGLPLLDAVRRVDESGELQWRLRNAVRGQRGFGASLSGWHDALEAGAFQQEQTAAHTLTTALLLLNGFYIGLLATGLLSGLSELGTLTLGSVR